MMDRANAEYPWRSGCKALSSLPLTNRCKTPAPPRRKIKSGSAPEIAPLTRYHARIYVTLRPSVLDPAGTAVQGGLQHLGYNSVEQVRIGKYVELSLQAESETIAREQLDRMCDQLLANPVIENYRFELEEAATGVAA